MSGTKTTSMVEVFAPGEEVSEANDGTWTVNVGLDGVPAIHGVPTKEMALLIAEALWAADQHGSYMANAD